MTDDKVERAISQASKKAARKLKDVKRASEIVNALQSDPSGTLTRLSVLLAYTFAAGTLTGGSVVALLIFLGR